MSLFRTHILIPIDEGTVQAGAFEVKRQLEKQLQERNLDQEIKVLETGTVGIVGKGVILVDVSGTGLLYPGKVRGYPQNRRGAFDQGKGREGYRALHPGSPVRDEGSSSGRSDPQAAAYHSGQILADRPGESSRRCWPPAGIGASKKSLPGPNSVRRRSSTRSRNRVFADGAAPDFPRALKWEFTRKAPGDDKYVICNADEGEPGNVQGPPDPGGRPP